jgi:hypothetical protein
VGVKSEVQKYAGEALLQLAEWYGSPKVTPKECEIIEVSEYGKELGFKKGNFIFQGVLLPTDIDHRGKRTVFDPEPRCIGKEQVYLEYKGFGKDGREMHFNTHRGGDVDFGMFFHYAESEYHNLLFAVQRQLLAPFPIALGKIPRKEFFKHGSGWLESIICQSESDCLPALQRAYNKSDDEFIKLLHKFGLGQYINAYESKQELGFVIRAARSPFRILTPEWKQTKHNTADPKKIAYVVGHTFYQLAFSGRFHTYPFPYNWTSAGELTDFEDVTDIAGIYNLDGCLTNFLDRVYSSLDDKNLLKPFFKGGLKKNMTIIDSATVLRDLIFDALNKNS